MFGLVPKPLWSKLMPADARNRIPQNANCLLVELDDGRLGLVDTGCGPATRFTEKEMDISGLGPGWPLLDELDRHRTEPAAIDFVILTHLHWDHAGGASTGGRGAPGELTFLDATHYVHQQEWEDALSGNPLLHQSYPAYVVDPLKNASIHVITSDRAEVLPGVHIARSGGHTRGHCTVVLEHPEIELNHPAGEDFKPIKSMVFAADVCPTSHHLRLVFQTAYDTFPLETRAWKRRELKVISEQGSLLLFDHDPDLLGATIRSDERREFAPAHTLAVT